MLIMKEGCLNCNGDRSGFFAFDVCAINFRQKVTSVFATKRLCDDRHSNSNRIVPNSIQFAIKAVYVSMQVNDDGAKSFELAY